MGGGDTCPARMNGLLARFLSVATARRTQDEWEGYGLQSEPASDGDDDGSDREDPIGLRRVLEQLLRVVATCDAVDMEQALWDL
jgi:hypothetical protein